MQDKLCFLLWLYVFAFPNYISFYMPNAFILSHNVYRAVNANEFLDSATFYLTHYPSFVVFVKPSITINIAVKMYKLNKRYNMCPWSIKAVISSTAIFVVITNNTLYGSKLYIFILCQKSLDIKIMFHEDIPTVNISKLNY